jgi:small-conductance mechanosensitive channel
MSGTSPPTDATGQRDWIEIVAAVLLALAAVATAWSSYQATRWNGEQAKAASAVNKTRIAAARAADLATSQTQVDIATFVQWVDAYAQERAELADFYRERFRAEFKPAFEAWLDTRPLQTPGAPPTPFAMEEYELEAAEEAERLDAEAEELAADVRSYIQRSSNYVLGVVLCAVALFFAGISTRLTTPRLRAGLVVLGWLVFAVALGWIATSPVSVAI